MDINLSKIATDTSLNPHDYFNAVKDCRQYITMMTSTATTRTA